MKQKEGIIIKQKGEMEQNKHKAKGRNGTRKGKN